VGSGRVASRGGGRGQRGGASRGLGFVPAGDGGPASAPSRGKRGVLGGRGGGGRVAESRISKHGEATNEMVGAREDGPGSMATAGCGKEEADDGGADKGEEAGIETMEEGMQAAGQAEEEEGDDVMEEGDDGDALDDAPTPDAGGRRRWATVPDDADDAPDSLVHPWSHGVAENAEAESGESRDAESAPAPPAVYDAAAAAAARAPAGAETRSDPAGGGPAPSPTAAAGCRGQLAAATERQSAAESAHAATARAAWLAAEAEREAEWERKEQELERLRLDAAANREEAHYARHSVPVLARDLQVRPLRRRPLWRYTSSPLRRLKCKHVP
jgi:hypothetical protein